MAIPETMQAFQFKTAKGGLENTLTLSTAPVPKTPSSVSNKPSVLVSVTSTSLNPADYKVVEKPILGSLIVRKPATPCLDFAGHIAHIPASGASKYPSLANLKPGDAVFGRLDFIYQHGMLAQYSLAQPIGLTRLPAGLSPAQAAALGTTGTTAYQALQPYVRAGDRVFVNGGSGGVGTLTIQIAKLLGAGHVTVSCSGANAELCRGLGADEVVDYRTVGDVAGALREAVTKEGGRLFDHVVDNVPTFSRLFEESPSFLKEGGTYIQVTGTDESVGEVFVQLTRLLQPAWLGGIPRKWKLLMIKSDPKLLDLLAEWVIDGKLKVVIDSEYAFEDAKQAFAKLKTGRARGKIVVNVAQNS